MNRTRLVALALALPAALALHRATPARANTAPPTPSDSPLVASPLADTLDDATIVAIFDAANTADIETGELAANRATNKEVRELGAMFARDHEMVRQQGRELAKKLGVTPTPPADSASAKAHADVMRMLRSRQGVEFDRAFLEHEVAFHKVVIDAVTTTLLPAIKNPELKALVQKVAPAFQAHMMAAERLAKNLEQDLGR